MNAERPPEPAGLRRLAMRALERHCEAAIERTWPEFDPELEERAAALRSDPPPEDAALAALAERLGLSDGEVLAAALCLAAEWDPHFARLVARAQDPIGSSRPLVGLACSLFASLGLTPAALAGGRGVQSGLFILGDEPRALPERSLAIGLPVSAALADAFTLPPGVTSLPNQGVEFAEAQLARLAADGVWLGEGREANRALVLRTPSRREAHAAIARIAGEVGRVPVLLAAEDIARHAVWLMAAGAMPCVALALGPGEARQLPPLGAYGGPLVCLLGLEGVVECGVPQREWTVPLPTEADRAKLWRAAGLDADSASLAARSYRQGAGRIAELAEQARHASGTEAIGWDGISGAVRLGRNALDSMAHKIHAVVERDELVLPAAALADLDLLLARILNRGDLAEGLGAAIRSRYGPGVRALFAGDPGTGKTLAAHWLAV
jgi:hypothetical protein